jgi:hypothetical protein
MSLTAAIAHAPIESTPDLAVAAVEAGYKVAKKVP